MEVEIYIPKDTPEYLIALAQTRYPNMWEDAGHHHGRHFFDGRSSEGDDPNDPEPISETFFDHDGAVQCCGFMEGLFGEGCDTMIEGNGGWAQGMLRRRDFSSYAFSDEERADYKRDSDLWWASHAEGAALAAANRALFIPLKREFFEAFERQEKFEEYRPLGPRWNAKTCRIGRAVILSLGYGKKRRLEGVITSFSEDADPASRPGWVACYGDRHTTAACIGIKVTSAP